MPVLPAAPEENAMTTHSTRMLDPIIRPVDGRFTLFGTLGWLVARYLRRRRNAAAAEQLRELPACRLADIGIEPEAIEEIRRHGVPSMRWTVHGYRPLHCTTGVDKAAGRP